MRTNKVIYGLWLPWPGALLWLHFPLRDGRSCIPKAELTLGQLPRSSAEQAQGPQRRGQSRGGCSCEDLRGLHQCEPGSLSSNSVPETWALLPTLFGILVTAGRPSWPPCSSPHLPSSRPHLLVSLPSQLRLFTALTTVSREAGGPAWRRAGPARSLPAGWQDGLVLDVSGSQDVKAEGSTHSNPCPTLHLGVLM